LKISGILEEDDLIGLRALGALDHVELDLIALLEGFVTIHLDGAVMDEYVRAVLPA